MRTNPRTGLRYVNVLSRIGGWEQGVWWRAGRTALAWHGLKSDKDFVAAFKQAEYVWQPPRWFRKELDVDQ